MFGRQQNLLLMGSNATGRRLRFRLLMVAGLSRVCSQRLAGNRAQSPTCKYEREHQAQQRLSAEREHVPVDARYELRDAQLIWYALGKSPV